MKQDLISRRFAAAALRGAGARLKRARVPIIAACSLWIGAAHAGVMLTDAAVFSANDEGENWNGWIWNTRGAGDDPANRWNVYYSTSSDPDHPSFVNSGNGSDAGIDILLDPGVHSFLIYGESVTASLDPLQHFVLNLYFGGDDSAPGISGLYGATCPTVCAAHHANGWDLFGNGNAQEAGTLAYSSGGFLVELTGFTWNVDENVDAVWPHWDNAFPYNAGSGSPDFLGELSIRVAAMAVPEPATGGLLSLALAGLWRVRGRRRTVV